MFVITKIIIDFVFINHNTKVDFDFFFVLFFFLVLYLTAVKQNMFCWEIYFSLNKKRQVLFEIENYKRDKVNSLAVLIIESDLTKKLDYDDSIDTFANEKARRKHF